jgi:hypothetical protein
MADEFPTQVSPLPQPPRCLTPFPFQSFPASRSPLSTSSNVIVIIDPSDVSTATPKPNRDPPSSGKDHTVSPVPPSSSTLLTSFHQVKSYKTPHISPTDSEFLTLPLSPLRSPRSVPLSLTGKKSIKAKSHSRSRYRPKPIVVPGPARTRITSPRQLTATPTTAVKAFRFPKTPGIGRFTARTAMPLTSKRVGSMRREDHATKSVEGGGEFEINYAEEPLLQREPSPGWAQFGATSSGNVHH